MRRAICFFRGHLDERVMPDGLNVVPTVGLTASFRVHPEGNYVGCRRCGRVARHTPEGTEG